MAVDGNSSLDCTAVSGYPRGSFLFPNVTVFTHNFAYVSTVVHADITSEGRPQLDYIPLRH